MSDSPRVTAITDAARSLMLGMGGPLHVSGELGLLEPCLGSPWQGGRVCVNPASVASPASPATGNRVVITPPSQFAAVGIGLVGLGALAIKARRCAA